MNAHDAIKSGLDTSAMISNMYVEDLTDAELLRRPAPGCNHINWQLGHLIVSEHKTLSKIDPSTPPLPAGFEEKYAMDKHAIDDPAAFSSKAELVSAGKQQREATLATLAKQSADDLDKPTGLEWAPTVGLAIGGQGAHWLMHAGQWAVVRRQLGRKPLF
jgi:hypothetical protein